MIKTLTIFILILYFLLVLLGVFDWVLETRSKWQDKFGKPIFLGKQEDSHIGVEQCDTILSPNDICAAEKYGELGYEPPKDN